MKELNKDEEIEFLMHAVKELSRACPWSKLKPVLNNLIEEREKLKEKKDEQKKT